jgi:hypothetical protein
MRKQINKNGGYYAVEEEEMIELGLKQPPELQQDIKKLVHSVENIFNGDENKNAKKRKQGYLLREGKQVAISG